MGITNFSDVNLKVVAVSGGSAGDVDVSGISTDDALVAVINIDFSGSNLEDLTSEFEIKEDGKINNDNGTGTDDLIVVYFDNDLDSR